MDIERIEQEVRRVIVTVPFRLDGLLSIIRDRQAIERVERERRNAGKTWAEP